MMAISPGFSRLVRFFVRRSRRATPPISVGVPRRRSRTGSRITPAILARSGWSTPADERRGTRRTAPRQGVCGGGRRWGGDPDHVRPRPARPRRGGGRLLLLLEAGLRPGPRRADLRRAAAGRGRAAPVAG